MGISPGTNVFLRNPGHDAVHLREQGLQKLLADYAELFDQSVIVSITAGRIRSRSLPIHDRN